ncbi:hypothetical protein QQZ08_005687 [Neonectria magnoliae]|uniref:Uncharacterized protein n=1 Tax=Neonectria magnoliae TaxID=2732573 RepID=A0ABR1I2K0_9HYPO
MTCGFFIICVPCIPKILKEKGVLRTIKRAFGVKATTANPNSHSDSYGKGAPLTSASVKSYYKLDEEGVPMKTLQGCESTEHLRDRPAEDAAGITRTTRIMVTQASRSTSDDGTNAMYMGPKNVWAR